MSNKTNQNHYKLFQKTCDFWIKELGLTDWKIYYFHQDEKDSYAWITPDSEAKQASIGLSVDWSDSKITKDMLKYCAKHEVLHLLLADLVQTGKYRQSSDTDFTTAQHAVIRRLEKVL